MKVDNSPEKRGCGRTWNSLLTMSRFVREVKGNDLLVTLRQYGQRYRRCSREKKSL